MDSGRNVDLQGACLQHAAGAVALFARMVDRSTRAAAGRAGLRADELAEDAARDLSQPAAAAARLAGADLGSGLGAATAAATAADRDAERHLARRPRGRLGELDLDVRRDVGATAAAGASGNPEQVVAEEGREQTREVAEVEGARTEAPASQARVSEAIVELAALGVRQHLVRLDNLTEALFCIGRARDIGMELARESPEGALDLVLTSIARDAEQFVVITLRRGHRFKRSAALSCPRRPPR